MISDLNTPFSFVVMGIITNEAKEALLCEYTYTSPFHFIAIDNFLKDEYANQAYRTLLNFNINKADYKYYDDKWEYKKYAYKNNLGAFFDMLFDYFHSDEFIDYIEKLTGIKNIIRNDKTLVGAGIHQTYPGGYLNVHTDFNTYTSEKYGRLDRRINLLIYLNPDWIDAYNGHLYMCEENTMTAKYRIAPLFNRCVIFNTTKSSLHGHPFPLATPEGVNRQSIAIYYYTKNTNHPYDFEGREKALVNYFTTSEIDFSGAETL